MRALRDQSSFYYFANCCFLARILAAAEQSKAALVNPKPGGLGVGAYARPIGHGG